MPCCSRMKIRILAASADPEQIRLATKESGRIFENLPNVNQEKYRQYAAGARLLPVFTSQG